MVRIFTIITFLLIVASLWGCQTDAHRASDYLDYSGRDDRLSGGIKRIAVSTPKGTFRVWTKRVGNNPRIKVLLLHGGPGANHVYWSCADSYFPRAGIEYYYYDQLGSLNSDIPQDTSLWRTERFVEEVEQVRRALGLNKDNFYLMGHSWGGLLALEYALKYQHHLKGLIISNMMVSIPDYIKYADSVLAPQMAPDILNRIRTYEQNRDYDNPEYLRLIEQHYYPQHVLRMPPEQWPEPVVRSFAHTNRQIYVMMQGPSEFGVAGEATLKNWDRKADLHKIVVPTLTIGGTYDTMDPKHMAWMAGQVQNGRFLLCPNGSHMSMYDDQQTYFDGVIHFIQDVDNGSFSGSD
ncbi:MAG: alpha/beta fold hydrolase [Calditrichaeota bacterium]|nr:MAG: alpha/beta fold hydrolase [Calditrichota bacterium]